jgi:hypothetical protein
VRIERRCGRSAPREHGAPLAPCERPLGLIEVIGINTAVAVGDSSIAASNIGFAISIDTALAAADAIIEAS